MAGRRETTDVLLTATEEERGDENEVVGGKETTTVETQEGNLPRKCDRSTTQAMQPPAVLASPPPAATPTGSSHARKYQNVPSSDPIGDFEEGDQSTTSPFSPDSSLWQSCDSASPSPW
eukprot:3125230-Rhodomonas_salina.2